VTVDKVSSCTNQRVCLNCLTTDSPECIANVTESSTAEQCLAKVGAVALVSFNQHGKCKAYVSINCVEMNTVYNSWVATPTCATSEYNRHFCFCFLLCSQCMQGRLCYMMTSLFLTLIELTYWRLVLVLRL